MRNLLAAALLLAATTGGTAQADLPFPLPGEPGPDLGRRPACTAAYVRSLERQVAAMQSFRRTAPEALERLCTMVELGGAVLGLDADLARMAIQCRIGQGNLERELVSRLGYLRAELVRCNDTI